MELNAGLMFPRISAKNHTDLFKTVGEALVDAGHVKDTYLEALIEREANYPTGVLVAGGGVALPHTDASHATSDTIAVATLTEPVPFAPMGGDSDEPVEVTTVIFLVLSEGKKHLQALSQTVKAIQDASFLQELHAITTPEGLVEAFSHKLGL